MKSFGLYLFIFLQTWRSINCEAAYENEDSIPTVSFDEDIGQTNFVDPYSFDYDRATKKMGNTEPAKSFRTKDSRVSVGGCEPELKECRDALKNFDLEGPFTIRLINLLLSNARLKENDDSVHSFITLSGTREQIEKLRQYGDGKVTLRQIDAILSDVIKPLTDLRGDALSLLDHLHMFIYQYGGIIASLFATVAILLLIKFVNWSTGKVIIIFLALVFLASYFMTWSQLIKDAEIRHFADARKHSQPPIQCEPEKMSIWDRISTYFIGSDQCFEYYKAMNFDPYHEVTPLNVLNELCNKLLLQSFSQFGSGISGFINNSTKHLSYPMQWIVTILLYIGVIGFFIMFPFHIFGSSLGLRLGPFFRISIGGRQTNQNNQPQQLQQQPQPQPITERREPITVILQVHSTGGPSKSPKSSTIVASVENQQLSIAGGGDSKSSKRDVDVENSSGSCKNCRCEEKSSSNNPHVKEISDLGHKSTESALQRNEKGDGDC